MSWFPSYIRLKCQAAVRCFLEPSGPAMRMERSDEDDWPHSVGSGAFFRDPRLT